jgi:FAD/FMN-containing dehydrogenase
MVLKPHSREDLSRALVEAGRSATKISAVDLSDVATLVEHQPEDMTATVEGGMTLGAFQGALRSAGQWLPIDPPAPDAVTISDLLAYDLSGPRRFGYGTIRDYLIGIRVALANGEIIHAGGKVVKNVAGYDLCKLFIGARHTLGVIVEGTFKLRPLPECEMILEASFDSADALNSAARAILASEAEPVLFDAHNLQERFTLVVGLAGATEDVDYQLKILHAIVSFSPGATRYDDGLRQKTSVRPSEAASFLKSLGKQRFVARLGNGVIYYEGSGPGARQIQNPDLMKRVKDVYDPQRIFPEYQP